METTDRRYPVVGYACETRRGPFAVECRDCGAPPGEDCEERREVDGFDPGDYDVVYVAVEPHPARWELARDVLASRAHGAREVARITRDYEEQRSYWRATNLFEGA